MKDNEMTVTIDMTCETCLENLSRIDHNELGPEEIIVIQASKNGNGYETHRHVLIFGNVEHLKRDL